jgi:hypothetical protein
VYRTSGPDTLSEHVKAVAVKSKATQVVEFVDMIVHSREEVATFRQAARAAVVEVLGDRPGVADLADEEGHP